MMASKMMDLAHRLLEKSEHPNRLQEIVQVIVKRGRLIRAVDVGVQFLCIGFYQRRFLKLGVHVEVAESKPVIERHGSEHEHYRERPKVELYIWF
jgi:DNA-binding MurR/RpiR family transcriptional regulator